MRVLLASVVALAAACGSKTSSAPPTTTPPPTLPPSAMDPDTQIQQLASRACACKKAVANERVGCARTVVHDLVALAQGEKKFGNETAAQEAGERLGKCVLDAGMPAQELADEMAKIDKPVES